MSNYVIHYDKFASDWQCGPWFISSFFMHGSFFPEMLIISKRYVWYEVYFWTLNPRLDRLPSRWFRELPFTVGLYDSLLVIFLGVKSSTHEIETPKALPRAGEVWAGAVPTSPLLSTCTSVLIWAAPNLQCSGADRPLDFFRWRGS